MKAVTARHEYRVGKAVGFPIVRSYRFAFGDEPHGKSEVDVGSPEVWHDTVRVKMLQRSISKVKPLRAAPAKEVSRRAPPNAALPLPALAKVANVSSVDGVPKGYVMGVKAAFGDYGVRTQSLPVDAIR
jgi:hypothetical protein